MVCDFQRLGIQVNLLWVSDCSTALAAHYLLSFINSAQPKLPIRFWASLAREGVSVHPVLEYSGEQEENFQSNIFIRLLLESTFNASVFVVVFKTFDFLFESFLLSLEVGHLLLELGLVLLDLGAQSLYFLVFALSLLLCLLVSLLHFSLQVSRDVFLVLQFLPLFLISTASCESF